MISLSLEHELQACHRVLKISPPCPENQDTRVPEISPRVSRKSAHTNNIIIERDREYTLQHPKNPDTAEHLGTLGNAQERSGSLHVWYTVSCENDRTEVIKAN